MSRLTHRANSADLGRPFLEYLQDCPSNRRISFAPPRRLTPYSGNPKEKYSENLTEPQQRRTSRGHRPMIYHYDLSK
jgi:hypothetical protein